jgi:putative isomerase
MAAPPPYRYDITFDSTVHGIVPHSALGPIVVQHSREEALGIVKDYLTRVLPDTYRQPSEVFAHPYTVPGGGYGGLWDWDSFFMCCAMPESSVESGIGTVLNMLAGVREDGHPSKLATEERGYTYDQHPYPLLAQFCYLMARRKGDFSWVEPLFEKLLLATRWYERNTIRNGRYFTWMGLMGNGIDNNPAVYGRPPWSSAGTDLATWHYREYRAMAKLCAILNTGMEVEFTEKADNLRNLVQERYWDTVDRSFYNIDVLADTSQITQQLITWDTHIKFRSWATLFPLWGKIATPEQASTVRDRIMSEAEFLAPCGVRSHSAIEPIYNNEPMGDPSNWQGPVWGLSTFLTAYGLAKYGFIDEALEVSFRLIRTYAADISQNGAIHEFYHGDTGQPLTNPGFVSWNLFALRIIDDIHNGFDSTSSDLMD